MPPERDPKAFYGFAITQRVIDREKIIAGGPGRDGIHAVDAPTFASAEAADADLARDAGARRRDRRRRARLSDADPRVPPGGERHVGGVPLLITYDPLTGAPLAWKRNVDGRTLRFGVSGLIYNSGFLLYDHETESLWSQFDGRALAGKLAGKRLEAVPLRQEDFASWLAREPKTKILIPPEPNHFDYNESAYTKYSEADSVGFPLEARDRRFHAKELVVGVVVGRGARAYLASLVTANGGRVEDEIDGKKIVVRYDPARGVFEWETPVGCRRHRGVLVRVEGESSRHGDLEGSRHGEGARAVDVRRRRRAAPQRRGSPIPGSRERRAARPPSTRAFTGVATPCRAPSSITRR